MGYPAYNEYTEMKNVLTFDKMQQLHDKMISEIGKDEDALELYEELVTAANKYSSFRSAWCLWTVEEKREKDESRSMCHNSLIVKFNQLARCLRMQGKSADWRDELGEEAEHPDNRKRIGDFACYIVFVNSLCAR